MISSGWHSCLTWVWDCWFVLGDRNGDYDLEQSVLKSFINYCNWPICVNFASSRFLLAKHLLNIGFRQFVVLILHTSWTENAVFLETLVFLWQFVCWYKIKVPVKYQHNMTCFVIIIFNSGWGKHIDKLVTGPAWKKMHNISAEEGLIALSYDRKFGEHRYSTFYISLD